MEVSKVIGAPLKIIDDPPPVVQNNFCKVKILFEAPTEPISILFWPFFFKIKWGWVPEVPNLGGLS